MCCVVLCVIMFQGMCDVHSFPSVPAVASEMNPSSPSHHAETAPIMSEYADSDNDSGDEHEQKVSVCGNVM